METLARASEAPSVIERPPADDGGSVDGDSRDYAVGDASLDAVGVEDTTKLAREEEQRYKRFLDASRLRSGEVQGMFASDLPPVSDAVEEVEPTWAHRGNKRDMLHKGPSFARLENTDSVDTQEESDNDSSSQQLNHHSSFKQWGQADNSGRLGPEGTSRVGVIYEEPHGPEPAAAGDVSAIAPSGPSGLSNPSVTFSQAPTQASPFSQAEVSGANLPPAVFNPIFSAQPVRPSAELPAGQNRPSGQYVPATAQISNMSPKPSERLGHSLGQQDRDRVMSRSETAGSDKDNNLELLGHLPEEDQMVLEFKEVSSWVATGGLPGSGKSKTWKERIKPSSLAKAAIKPFKDTAVSVGKAGKAAGKAAGSAVVRTTSTLTRRRKRQEDIEMGTAGANKPKPQYNEGFRQILHSISGQVGPGQVLALMGPSGSGKTSLLSIIGGRAPNAVKLDGLVTVNGMRLNKTMRKRIGFVLQDDVLYETLTVHETLMYAGLLRLPRTMTRAEKMGRVDAVIEVLGLTKSRDTIIGGYFRRGVSGGERKRVSVGHELLINPAVLLLDEPTSGLDSTTALHLVTLLRDLAAGGRAILTTIHQPSSRLYRKLDQVMLLAEGHVMYYGDALHAVDWFDHLGFGLPYGTNLADHILDCAMGEVQFNPEAPGAVGHDGFRHGRDREAGSKEKSMHGSTAVRALYTTFEQWYREHPDGFSVEREKGTIPEGGRHTRDSVSRASSSAVISGLLGTVHLAKCGRRSSSIALPAGSTANPANTHAANPAAAVNPLRPDGTVVVTRIVNQTNNTIQIVIPDAQQVGGRASDVQTSRTSGSGDSHSQKLPGQGDVGLKAPLPPKQSSLGAPFLQQVFVLWQRALKVRRFESLSGQNLFQLTGVALICGCLWFQKGAKTDLSAGSDILGLLFFEMLFVSFRSLFSALFTFPNEFRMLSKERPSGMYKLSAYYISRTLADLPIEILYPTIFVIIIYFMGGLRLTAGAFFANWSSVLVVVLTAQTWGLLLGGAFMDPKMAQTVTTVLMLTFLLVGGYYVRNVPVWIDWLKYLSFIYWGNNLLLKIQFRHNTLEDCSVSPCKQLTGNELQDALRLTVPPDNSVWPEVVVLLGMLGALRWATYMVLRWKTGSSTQKQL